MADTYGQTGDEENSTDSYEFEMHYRSVLRICQYNNILM